MAMPDEWKDYLETSWTDYAATVATLMKEPEKYQ